MESENAQMWYSKDNINTWLFSDTKPTYDKAYKLGIGTNYTLQLELDSGNTALEKDDVTVTWSKDDKAISSVW